MKLKSFMVLGLGLATLLLNLSCSKGPSGTTWSDDVSLAESLTSDGWENIDESAVELNEDNEDNWGEEKESFLGEEELLGEEETEGSDLSSDTRRGNPWEYDAGPKKDSKILEIFSRVPNYRAIGESVIGQKRFRWEWGPVYYRGRLGENEVKILVIGQEGGQDEGLSKKTFTGGTGQHLQGFLNFLGINRSYLFVNTFIYSIRGQYQDKKLPGAVEGDLWMAQNLDSPIVKLRHELLNEILESNRDTLRMVIAVGSGAKDTLGTWVLSKGGTCKTSQDGKPLVDTCTSDVLSDNLVLVGVAHPGMTGQVDKSLPKDKQKEQLKNFIDILQKSFSNAANLVARKVYQDRDWMPVDEGGFRPEAQEKDGKNGKWVTFEKEYKYRSAPVPFRDFPFGFNWRLGSNSTVSNRTMDQRSIKIFSSAGKYNEKANWFTPKGADYAHSGFQIKKGSRDLPYEQPKEDRKAYDPGPGREWARLLMGSEPGFEWPDFNELGVRVHPSFGHGTIYRGRLDEARVLVLADQDSHDDMFTARALSGDGGQKIQHLLSKLGITKSYVIIRTLPVDTLDLPSNVVDRVNRNQQVVKVRNEILNRIFSNNKVQLVLTFGPHADEAWGLANEELETRVPVYNLKAADEKGAADSWNGALESLSRKSYEKDDKAQPSFRYDSRTFKDTRLEVNRYDLPFGTIRWKGTSGSLASRALDNPELYQMTMPLWAAGWKTPALSRDEEVSLRDGGWLK